MFRLRPSEDELLDWLMWIAGPVLALCFLSMKKKGYHIQMTAMGFELSKEDVMRSAFLVTDKSDLKHHLKMEKQVKVDLRDFC